MAEPTLMVPAADRRVLDRLTTWLLASIADYRLPWLHHARSAFHMKPCYGVRLMRGHLEGMSPTAADLAQILVLPEPFCLYACRGMDHEKVCRVLLRAGLMQATQPIGFSVVERLPMMGRTSVYKIDGAILAPRPLPSPAP